MIALWVLLSCVPDVLVAAAGPDQVAFVGDSITLDASGSTGGTAYRWRLQGGTALEGETVTLELEEPGRVVVVLEVEDRRGLTTTDTVLLRVAGVPMLPPPSSSSPVVGTGEWVFAAVSDLDHVVGVNRLTGAIEKRFETCAGPRQLSVADRVLWVACEADAVEWFDLDSGATGSWQARWGARPSAIAHDSDGDAFVALHGTEQVVQLDVNGVEVARFDAVDPIALAVGDEVIAGSMRGSTLTVLGSTPTVALLPASTGPDSDTDARGVPSVFASMAVRPDGEVVAVGGMKHNIERGLVRDGRALTPESTARATVRFVDPSTGEQVGAHAFDNRDRAAAVAYNPHGDLLFVGHHGSGIVDVLDAITHQRVGGWTGLGVGIEGLLVDEQMVWVLVAHERTLLGIPLEPLTGLADAAAHRVDLLAGRPDPVDPEVLRGKQVFHDASDPRMSLDSYLSCASCHPDGEQDAHVWDFTARGEGLRNTRSLRGGGLGPLHWSANFDEVQDFEGDIRNGQGGRGFLSESDWLATSDSLGLPKSGLSADLDAIDAYVRSLPRLRSPHRNPSGTRTIASIVGEQVFVDLGCPVCHALPETSDSQWIAGEPVLHDVGTLTADSGSRLGGPLTGLDTPSLRGLFATAPYFHDGSAPTLADVLDHPDPAHDSTALSDEERAELIAFLLELE